MWQYNQSNELRHYGKLGMKWGRRSSVAQNRADRARSEASTAGNLAKRYTGAIDKRLAKKPNSINRLSDSKNARKLADAYTNAMNKKATDRQNRADRKERVKNLRKEDTLAAKLTYNKATYKYADKLIQKRGMEKVSALKKAKGQAWVNTAIATVGLVTYAAISAKKYS